MATIQECLNNILKAVYGKDVRQSIHDAIKQCYEDVTNPELNIEAFATAVQNKIDSGELAALTLADKSVTSEKLADGSITQEKLAPDIEIGVKDGEVTEEKIAKWAVTMEKTDFCRKIDNVYYDATADYNKGNVIIDSVISNHSGESLKVAMYGMTKTSSGYITGYSVTFGYNYSMYYNANIVVGADVKRTENEIPYIEAIITPEQIQEIQQKDNFDHIWVKVGNASGAGTITRAVIIPADIEITDELINNDFSQEIVSDEFVHAVNRAIEEGDIEVGDDNIKELNGKIMLSLGDSFTAHLAGAYTDGVSESTSGKFHDLANKYGMTLYSYGIVSSTIKTDENGGYSYQPMATRVDKLISDHLSEANNVGVITFMGGLNDSYGRESSLGNNIADMSKGHTYGACHYIFSSLLNNFPNAEIFVILQPCGANRANDDTDYDGNDTSAMTDIQFSTHISQVKQKIVREVAEFYGLNIVDCCFDWYNPNNPNDLITYWGSDKLHLTDSGYKELSKKLEKKIISVCESRK